MFLTNRTVNIIFGGELCSGILLHLCPTHEVNSLEGGGRLTVLTCSSHIEAESSKHYHVTILKFVRYGILIFNISYRLHYKVQLLRFFCNKSSFIVFPDQILLSLCRLFLEWVLHFGFIGFF